MHVGSSFVYNQKVFDMLVMCLSFQVMLKIEVNITIVGLCNLSFLPAIFSIIVD